jgi:hypothetical protein
VASARLEIRTRVHRDGLGPEPRAESRRVIRHHLALEVASDPQPVVDMHRDRFETAVRRECKQREGIGPTGAPDDHRWRDLVDPDQAGAQPSTKLGRGGV